jgi:iron complex transport system permease protein
MLFSAMLVLLADILGRIVGYPGEVSVGVMVALIGGPCFVLLVKRWQGERV